MTVEAQESENIVEIKDNPQATFAAMCDPGGLLWEELPHPVSRDQQKKECPERMCTGKGSK